VSFTTGANKAKFVKRLIMHPLVPIILTGTTKKQKEAATITESTLRKMTLFFPTAMK
jgi:hypothetical protein